jgi:hypothetical protein
VRAKGSFVFSFLLPNSLPLSSIIIYVVISFFFSSGPIGMLYAYHIIITVIIISCISGFATSFHVFPAIIYVPFVPFLGL